MPENPFHPPDTPAVPAALTTYEEARRRLRRVALPLVLLSAMSLMLTGIAGALSLRTLLAQIEVENVFEDPTASGELMASLLMCLTLPLANAVALAGSISMWRMSSLSNARLAALISCIPVCSPLVFVGVPLGIWALLLLFNAHLVVHFRAR